MAYHGRIDPGTTQLRRFSTYASNSERLWAMIPDGRRFYETSEVYTDWYHRHGLDSGVSFGTSLRRYDETLPLPATDAFVSLFHEDLDAPATGERAVLIAGLLVPALAAGVDAHLRLNELRDVLARTLDAVSDALMVCGSSGDLLHLNEKLQGILRADPEGERVRNEMEILGREILALGQSRKKAEVESTFRAPARRITTRSGTYRIRGTMLDDSLLPGSSVIVSLEKTTGAVLPTAEQVRTRLGVASRASVGRQLLEN